MTPTESDDFFIGWHPRASRIGESAWRVVLGILVVGAGLGAWIAASQRTIQTAAFEYGRVKNFTGIVYRDPIPVLAVPRPGIRGPYANYSLFPIVNPWKFGVASEWLDRFDGQPVFLEGTLIYRDFTTMIEIVPETTQIFEADFLQPKPLAIETLSSVTLRGEIVDSKCFLGVMNPGNLKPHRACAVRCISGGIPPLLMIRQASGAPLYLWITGPEGEPIGPRLLPWVAVPIEVSGTLHRFEDQLSIAIQPNTLRRIHL